MIIIEVIILIPPFQLLPIFFNMINYNFGILMASRFVVTGNNLQFISVSAVPVLFSLLILVENGACSCKG